ncbi:MAG TPA: sigma 54-interacting transcriptional regulator [Candidatus Methylomirabilis sp.]|nr:sigma 54-interacting transcriptional regulator [Candidatus Methylomirabilis sp.]
MRQDLADPADLLSVVAAVGHPVQDVFDPQHFLEEFSRHLDPMIPHDGVMIAFLEDEGRTFTVFAEHRHRGPSLHEGRYTTTFDPGGRYPLEEWGLADVFAGRTLMAPDAESDAGLAEAPATRARLLRAGFRARLAVPLASGGRVIGALLVGSTTAAAFTLDHVEAARRVAHLIGPFIENIVAFRREQRRRGRLEGLVGLMDVLGTSLDAKDVFDRLEGAVRPILDFDIMVAALIDSEGRDVEHLGRIPERAGREPRSRVSADDFSFSAALRSGQAVLLRDIPRELDPEQPGDRRVIAESMRSALAVPLWFGERVGGNLFFAKRRGHWYDASDVEIAGMIAAHVALAVQHQRLAEERERAATAERRAQGLRRRLDSLREQLAERFRFDQIVGRSSVLRQALDAAAKVAPMETTVLITGESGTGKELVALAIHHASPRAHGPFVAVNCAALPESLLESELFGHERGAFTGADRQKPGRFERASSGTLFLDEIGEMSPAVQAKLLRVLEEHEFERVGGTAALRADVRVIAATNRDLEQAVNVGAFRADLYYRLNVFTVRLPPLRERADDVQLLAEHIAAEIAPSLGREAVAFSDDALAALSAHPWRGNVRELRNAVERALIVSEGDRVTASDLGLSLPEPGPGMPAVDAPPPPPASPDLPGTLAEWERRQIVDALGRAEGKKARAARYLGLTRSQLYTRLKRHGIGG